MFEHTHRNNAVKMTGLMAIVTQVKIKLVLSAAEITLFIGKVKLAFGQGDAGYMRFRCAIDQCVGQTTPATTDVKNMLFGL